MSSFLVGCGTMGVTQTAFWPAQRQKWFVLQVGFGPCEWPGGGRVSNSCLLMYNLCNWGVMGKVMPEKA